VSWFPIVVPGNTNLSEQSGAGEERPVATGASGATIRLMAAAMRETLQMVDRLMLEMIGQQDRKVLDMARRIHPGVTEEDLRNPHDFPDLANNGEWNFEDGILAGLKSAHVALRAKIIESID
jgi:hypothetical protein